MECEGACWTAERKRSRQDTALQAASCDSAARSLAKKIVRANIGLPSHLCCDDRAGCSHIGRSGRGVAKERLRHVVTVREDLCAGHRRDDDE